MIHRLFSFPFKFVWRCIILSIALLTILFRFQFRLWNEIWNEICTDKETTVLLNRLNFNTVPAPSPIRKPIKLLKLPLLVQREILQSMRITDLFTLSLCSSKVYNLIKIWRFKIDCLCYREYRNGFWVYNRPNDHLFDRHNQYIVFVSFVSKYKHDRDQMRANFGGVSIDFQWRRWGIEYIDVSGDFIQSATQRHINGLFKILNIDLELSPENLKRDNYLKIRNATDILFDNYTEVKSSTFQEIIQMHPNLKSVYVKGRIDGEVDGESPLFQTDEVIIQSCGLLTPLFLNNFDGRLVWLHGAKFEKTDIIQLVRQWISGEKFTNLSTLYLYSNESQSDLEIYRNALAPLAKQWERPEVYEYYARFIGTDRSTTNYMRLWPGQCMDFERETDQKMATFVYTAYNCRLLVWN